jgi:anaerobic ribonucleoside-triphosphate reductase activating protein
LLGGEPLEKENQQGLLPLLRQMTVLYPEKSVWCFTGYDYEKDIIGKMYREWEETKEFLSYLDVLVDGEFQVDKKDLGLVFKGSSNQRTILVPLSLQAGKVIEWDDGSRSL